LTFFRHTFFKQPPKLIQKSINGKRHYIDPTGSVLQKGVALPSVTTVLSALSEEGIKAWKNRVGEAEANKVSTRALANGNELHSIIENYLDNKPITEFKNETSLKLFDQAKEELHKINNIKAQEVQLYSQKIGVAGRVDCIAEYDGKLSVIDFKSARKKKQKSWIKSYFLQATCYALMYEELTGEGIDQIVILISAEDGTVQPFVEDKEQYISVLEDVVYDYQMRQKNGQV
jgi:genome maintenance exonuclease 1